MNAKHRFKWILNNSVNFIVEKSNFCDRSIAKTNQIFTHQYHNEIKNECSQEIKNKMEMTKEIIHFSGSNWSIISLSIEKIQILNHWMNSANQRRFVCLNNEISLLSYISNKYIYMYIDVWFYCKSNCTLIVFVCFLF